MAVVPGLVNKLVNPFEINPGVSYGAFILTSMTFLILLRAEVDSGMHGEELSEWMSQM